MHNTIMSSPGHGPESDFEFYCFLKANLPKGYEIIAEPQTSYYSEWKFCYQVYFENQLIKSYAGDFRQIAPGSLVHAAEELLKEYGVRRDNRK